MRFSRTIPPSDDVRQSLYPVLLLVLVVLGVYWRAVSGTIVTIDDAGIMKFYSAPHLSLSDVLRPGQGYYYRPVIALSFFLDYWLLGQNPVFLHLENILIHAANAVLVYLLAARLLPKLSPIAPFFAALIFAVHPVNCEAVSWIAGRTDPLAALFVLLAALSLCRGLASGALPPIVLSLSFFVAAVMTKETAIMFIPASLVLVAAWPALEPECPVERLKKQGRVLFFSYLVGALFLAGLLVARQGSQSSLAKFLTGNINDFTSSVSLLFKSLGFYLKKMLVPWPLNFAIDELAPWYGLAGIAGLIVLFMARKKGINHSAILIGLLFLFPALVVAACNIAWTIVAERYLYIPSVFFSIGLTGCVVTAAEKVQRPRVAFLSLGVCIAIGFAATLHRTGVWQSNLSLFQDSASKSPRIGMLHHQLAFALAKDGRLQEAKRELDIAASLDPSEMLKQMIGKSRLLIALQEASPERKRLLLHQHGWSRVKEDPDLLRLLRSTDYQLLLQVKGAKGRDDIVAELVEVSDQLYAHNSDPLLLYNNGQLLLKWGDRARARSYFLRSAEAAPEGIYYKSAAQQVAARLAGDR